MGLFRTMIFAAALVAPVVALAHGGGMGSGGQAGAMGGPGMLTVADDGSLLVTEMGYRMMGGGGGGGGGMGASLDRELLNISPTGQIRWRSSFDEGWPMMAVTDGDLVVFTLREDWWMGSGSGGDGGDPGGGDGGGPGGPGGPGGSDPHTDSVIVVGLDLNTGTERWRTEIAGDMVANPQFSTDGGRIYLTARDLDAEGAALPGGPMNQGDAPLGHMLMSTSVIALDRDGIVLWSVVLSDESP